MSIYAELLKRIDASKYLLSILMKIEKVLSDAGIYVFDGWKDAEIYDGPYVSRYWIEVSIVFDKKPDFNAVKILDNIGIKYEGFFLPYSVYIDQNQLRSMQPTNPVQVVADPMAKEEETPPEVVTLYGLRLLIPKQLITRITAPHEWREIERMINRFFKKPGEAEEEALEEPLEEEGEETSFNL